MTNSRHVTQKSDGSWDVKAPGAQRSSANLPTQRDADRRAAEILTNLGGGERITHRPNGRIRSKDTIAPGNDPFPPKDREH
ncbi:DUF2188 domain-containing protein [Patulibacter sp. NPDC049589]|uniref:DUF2188 domain-containing protein n=1 Tax=Patulibacter sp. NPDC049589 TaxID=3154731 RepID=UPI00341DD6E4